MQPYSLYLHIPFCKHRCAYCDFNTYAGQDDSIPAYVNALICEIEYVGSHLPTPDSPLSNLPSTAHTIFFGGGTPSLLSGPQFASVMDALRAAFPLTADAEVSIEANPGTISPENLDAIRAAGINRISFGVQSANTEELRMLERIHDFFTVIEAVQTARQAGFDNLNLDLIYGLPEQTLQSWQTTVQRIVDLHPEHISAYALTLEHGTPFGRWSARGLLPLPDPDLAAEMYEWADDYLEANGYVQYEISNWAVNRGPRTVDREIPSHACRHNLQYWRSLPYLAFGAGAHGYANGYRYSNVLRIKTYIERLSTPHFPLSPIFPLTPATVNHHRQTASDDMGEFMMTGLRLTKAGVAEPDFRSRFGRGLTEAFGRESEDLTRKGLLEWAGDRLRLTKRGRLLGNQVFMQFIA
jgi:oxygen-independent coproporphyrinogen-3 oxidase